MRFLTHSLSFFALLLLAYNGAALAEDYPNRSVRIVVPYAVGGGNDRGARLLAQKLSDQLKQPFVVENRPDISGVMGSSFVSTQKPDGYTLLYGADTVLSAMLLPDVKFDVERDLTPITEVGFTPFFMVINSKIPANNPKELVAYAKQNPKEFRWALAGFGTPPHMAIERFAKAAGINLLKVPYNGGGPAQTAVLSGEVTGMLATWPAVQGMVESGKLKNLGILSLEPVALYPGVPTVASFGFPGIEATSWSGVWGPKGMSEDLANQIRTYVVKAMTDPEMQKQFAAAGISVELSKNSKEFSSYIHSELEGNRTLVKDLNIDLTQLNSPPK